MARFALSEVQAQAILDMRLQRLTGLEREKIVEEYRELLAPIERLREILGSEQLVLERSSSTSSPRSRRSSATSGAPRSSPRDARHLASRTLIAEEDMVITVSHAGYIKRSPLIALPRAAPRRQGADRDGDQGRGLRRAPLRRLGARYILVFTERGRCTGSRCTRSRRRAARRAARRSSTC